MINLGKAIALQRIECGLTQTELAKRLNVSTTPVCRYETNKQTLTIDMLGQIAEALCTTVSALTIKAEHTDDTPTNKKEAKMLQAMRNLNDEGQSTAIERVKELQKIPDYRQD